MLERNVSNRLVLRPSGPLLSLLGLHHSRCLLPFLWPCKEGSVCMCVCAHVHVHSRSSLSVCLHHKVSQAHGMRSFPGKLFVNASTHEKRIFVLNFVTDCFKLIFKEEYFKNNPFIFFLYRLLPQNVGLLYVGGYERPFAQIKVWLFIFQYTFLRCSSLVQKPPISKISWMWTSNFICFCISAEEVIQFCKELIILLFLPIQLTLTKIFAIS